MIGAKRKSHNTYYLTYYLSNRFANRDIWPVSENMAGRVLDFPF